MIVYVTQEQYEEMRAALVTAGLHDDQTLVGLLSTYTIRQGDEQSGTKVKEAA